MGILKANDEEREGIVTYGSSLLILKPGSGERESSHLKSLLR